MTGRDLVVDPLLEAIDLDYEGLRVAAIGGGHGLAGALRAILDYADLITAVVGVADDGGSSGRLAPALGLPPPGDIRRALVALSPEPSLWRDLMEYRFDGSDVDGHSLGNLMLAALTDLGGDFEEALQTAGRLMGAKGAVLPVTTTPLGLRAVIEDREVHGQVSIAQGAGPPSEMSIVPPDVEATPAALAAISGADQIVLGPGSLFTSTIAPLKVLGVSDSINAAPGNLTYVANLTTQDGETLGMDGEAHLAALMEHGGVRAPDSVVVHDGPLQAPPGLERVVFPASLGDGIEVARGAVADESADWPQHDPARLGAILRRLA